MFAYRTDNVTGEPFYEDLKTGLLYRRVVSALAWPYGDEQGSVITLGEHYAAPSRLYARRPVRVLRESRSFDSDDLLLAAARARRLYLVDTLVTPIEDERFVLLEEFNDQQRRARLPILRADNPIKWRGKGEGLIPYYAELVGRRLGGEKSLYFGDDCSGSLEMQRLTPEDSHKAAIEYPGICALCWALEYIDAYPLREWGDRAYSPDRGPADPVGGY